MWVAEQKRKAMRKWRISRLLAESKNRANRLANPLPHKIVVSLTSFTPRFLKLHQVIESLIWQTMTPDLIVLYLKKGHEAFLPSSVSRLVSERFRIEWRDDNRSYDKLVHALNEFPQDCIITVDDDIVYQPDMVQQLVEGHLDNHGAISCLRGHRISFSHDGYLLPYMSWKFNVVDEFARRPSVDLVPTGVGGVLYPPKSLDARATDIETAKRLAPTADDLWFYWMARLAGSKHVKVGPYIGDLLYTEGSQESGLIHANWDGANDRQIKSLWDEFGRPLGLDERVKLHD